MTYTKDTLKEAIIQKLRLNYRWRDDEGLRYGAAGHYGRARCADPREGRP